MKHLKIEEDRQKKAKAALTKMSAAQKLAQLTHLNLIVNPQKMMKMMVHHANNMRGKYWSTYKGKKSKNWLICDLCDQYICPKCVPKDVDLNKDFFCSDCSAGD